ncbi:MAG: molybdenum cofactor guanylyltransferase, partial [Ktedonobacterales bacterium]
ERGTTHAATIGVVLAGGQSRRMGASKASLLIGGEPLLRRVTRQLAEALPAVLVVGAPELAALVPSLTLLADRRPGAGPLAGIEAALAHLAALPGAPYARAFVVACDMPFVAPALVRAMASAAAADPRCDALVLRSARGIEQLHAVYSLACLPVASALLDAGAYALRELLARVRTSEFPSERAAAYDPAARSAFNANTPADWEYVLQNAGSGPDA